MQRTTGKCFPMLTVITSSVEGDVIIEQGKVASTAFSTPPPRELLSLRRSKKKFTKNVKIRNRISQSSLSNTVHL